MTETRANEQWLDDLLSLEPDHLDDSGFKAAVLARIDHQSRKREIILWSIGLVAASITIFFIPTNIMNYLPYEYLGKVFTLDPASNSSEIIVMLFSAFSLLGIGWLFSETL